ncbi:MAG: hypothetical protein CTY12_00885 [Methylotenera sp.]|nr:MAG: hypothetical protein CTY12_00885 [Methylotenera sp.]
MKYVMILFCLSGCSDLQPVYPQYKDRTDGPITYQVITDKQNKLDNGHHYPIYKSRHQVE